MRHSIIAAAAAVLLPAAVQVLEHTAPSTLGSRTSDYLPATQFTLASDAQLIGATATIADIDRTGLSTWDGTMQAFFFADDAGLPGAALASGLATVVETVLDGQLAGTIDLYKVAFNFAAPFDAAAGTTYWFGLHMSADYVREDGYAWMESSDAGRRASSEGGTQDNWQFQRDFTLVYALHDEALVASAPSDVPLPAAAPLMLMGLAGLGLAARRRGAA
ncbi:VPLPA-CTERM sorting domain-containing protein [Rhodovulum sp. DZ06]|uniref:VPLPA-CTERM sorting domain-containing protein n=1 Tax=Rhodovulum sp. DZ06 TaxID=3425126 RepID=UPI003D33955D